MSSRFSYQAVATPLHDHPAVEAWERLHLPFSNVKAVETLKTGNGKDPSGKSTIFRIQGVLDTGKSVVAKRTKWASVQFEQIIYREILPQVPIHSIHCFGAVKEQNSNFGWLFLEEAVGDWYSEENIEHRTIAAEWLAALHTTTATFTEKNNLPEHGVARYFPCIGQIESSIRHNFNNPALIETDKVALNNILGHLAYIKSLWRKFELVIREMPRCLVHGDFVGKNVRVSHSSQETKLCVLDWDIAGWGTPSVDIEYLDTNLYWLKVKKAWHNVSRQDVENMKNIGVVLRNLGLIQATCWGLEYDRVDWVIEELRNYDLLLIRAVEKFLLDN